LAGSIAPQILRLTWPQEPGAFRFVLAMIVFVHHFSGFTMGKYAVYVFFVLSGFWLHVMWVERYAGSRRPYLTYLVSRVWRLAPVMALVSAITIPFLLVIGQPAREVLAAHPLHLFFSSTFLLGYAWLDYLPVGSAWSLDVEMQFYVITPLLTVLLLRRFEWPLLLAATVASAIGATVIETPTFPKYAIFFILGMSAAASGWAPSKRLATTSALCIPVIIAIITISPWSDALWGGADATEFHHRWNPVLNVVLALMTVPFALHTVRQKSDRTDRMLADLSYIVYLAHWAGMQLFFTLAGHPFVERLEVAAASFLVIPLVSYGIWRFYDKPLNAARARWVASRAEPKAIAPKIGVLHAEPAGP
jgi:peptidoglycan/LPS O-acetylase OafA/YrhL